MRLKYYGLVCHRGTRRWESVGVMDNTRNYESEAEARAAVMRYIKAFALSDRPVVAWRVTAVQQKVIAAGGC